MQSLYIIGDADTVLGYRFAGVPGTVAEDAEAARTALRAALGRVGCTVLLVTRPAAAGLRAELDAHRRTGQPPYVAVVTDIGSRREDGPSLEAMIQAAIGIRGGEAAT